MAPPGETGRGSVANLVGANQARFRFRVPRGAVLGCVAALALGCATHGDYVEAANAVVKTAAARRAGVCYARCAPGLICQASSGFCCHPDEPGCFDPAELARFDGGSGLGP